MPRLSAVADPIDLESVEDAQTVVARLLSLAESSLQRRAQLEHALMSRIVIEQAKGVLAERYEIEIDEAFEVLRRASRNTRTKIHEIAAAVVASRETPPAVDFVLRSR